MKVEVFTIIQLLHTLLDWHSIMTDDSINNTICKSFFESTEYSLVSGHVIGSQGSRLLTPIFYCRSLQLPNWHHASPSRGGSQGCQNRPPGYHYRVYSSSCPSEHKKLRPKEELCKVVTGPDRPFWRWDTLRQETPPNSRPHSLDPIRLPPPSWSLPLAGRHPTP